MSFFVSFSFVYKLNRIIFVRVFPISVKRYFKDIAFFFDVGKILTMTGDIVKNGFKVPFEGKQKYIALYLLEGYSAQYIMENMQGVTHSQIVELLGDDRFRNFVSKHASDLIFNSSLIAVKTLTKIMQDDMAKDTVKKDCAKIIGDWAMKLSENQMLNDASNPANLSSEQLTARLDALMKEGKKRQLNALPSDELNKILS